MRAEAQLQFVVQGADAAPALESSICTFGTQRSPAEPTSSFLKLVQEQADRQPGEEFCVWIDNKAAVSDSRTFGGLWKRAESVARMLSKEGVVEGDRVIMCFNFGLSFLDAFLGCMRLGAVAVPLYPPNPGKLREALEKLSLVVRDCNAKFGLLDPTVNALRISTKGWPEGMSWFVPRFDEKTVGGNVTHSLDSRRDEDVAFLQYTSGSTGDPKGVMLTFGNIHSNMTLNNSFEPRLLDANARGCSWLPQFHDMGLLAATLYPLARGRKQVFMSPITFLKQPVLWMEAVSKFKCTWVTAPNFAYGLSARKLQETPRDQRPNLDLSGVTSLCNAAEPVRLDTMREFSSAFGEHKLHNATWFASFGLAEHTVLGTSSPASVDELASLSDRSGRFVACGDLSAETHQDVDVRIVKDGEEVEDGEVGEIWMRSASCGVGYWGNEERSQETFRAVLQRGKSAPRSLVGTKQVWMRTGDEGFVEREERGGIRRLFVCGRIKDLIIVRGKNLYPQDVEQTAEQASSGRVRLNCSAAFQSVQDDGSEVDAVEIVAELKHSRMPESEMAALCEEMAAAVRREHSVSVRRLLLIRPRTIPKTTSGKIRRKETSVQARSGRLLNKTLLVWEDLSIDATHASHHPADANGARDAATDKPEDAEGFLRVMVEEVAVALELPDGEAVDVNEPLFALGLESVASATLTNRLARRLGIDIAPDVLFSSDSMAATALSLWQRSQEDASLLSKRTDGVAVNGECPVAGKDAPASAHPSPASVSKPPQHAVAAHAPSSDESASGFLAVVFRCVVQATLIFWLLLSIYLCAIPALAAVERVALIDMFPLILFRELVEPRAFAPVKFQSWGDNNGVALSDLPRSPSPLIDSSWLGVPLALMCGTGVFVACFTLYVVTLKWTLLGRVREGAYPLWGSLYWRRWVVQRHVEVLASLSSPLFQDAAPLSLLYSLLGARIGRGCDAILQLGDVDCDLIEIGDRASVSSAACVITAVVSNNVLHLRRVHVGPGCHVADGAVLCPGVVLPRNTKVKTKAVVTLDSLACGSEGKTIEGNPGLIADSQTQTFAGCGGSGWFEAALIPGCWICCLLLVSAACVVPVVALHKLAVQGVSLSGFAMVAVAVAYMSVFLVSLCVATVVTKWALLGRRLQRGGRIEKGSWAAVARECVHRLHALVSRFVLIYLWGGEMINWYYRAMGAKIGSGARVSILVGVSDWDAVELGDMVLVGGGATLAPSEVEDGTGDRVMGGVRIGEGTTVGFRCRAEAGSVVGKRSLVTCLSHVTPNTEVGDHLVVAGTKTHRSLRSCHVPRPGLPRSVPVIREASLWAFQAAWTSLAVWAALYLVWALRVHCGLPALLLIPAGGGAYQLLQLWALVLCKRAISRFPRPADESDVAVHTVSGWWRYYAQLHLDTAYSYTLLGQCLKGGPLANLHLKSVGARVHVDAYVGSTWVYDAEHLEIAAGAAINAHVNLSPHLVLSCSCATVSPISIGRNATLWPQAVCVGRTAVPAGMHVGPESRLPASMTVQSEEAGDTYEGPGEARMLLGVPGKCFVGCGLQGGVLEACPSSSSAVETLPV